MYTLIENIRSYLTWCQVYVNSEKNILEKRMEEKNSKNQTFAAALLTMDFKASNLAKEWKTWLTKFKIFLRASNLESETDKRKVALLLNHLGSQSLEIFNSFDVDIDTVKYEDLVRMLGSHFTPKAQILHM